jgi:hypothetical protein
MPDEPGTETLQEEQLEGQEELTETPPEGNGEEGKEDLSKNVQKRIDKLTKKMRDFERTAQEKETIIQDLLEIVKQKTVVEPQRATSQPAADPEIIMTQLRGLLTDARKDLDWDKVALLEREIDKVKDQITEQKISSLRTEHENKARETDSKADIQRIVTKWSSDAQWFDKDSDKYDPIMAGAAIEYDKVLGNKPEWKNKPLMERLNKVRDDIEKRFRYEPPPRMPTVEGGNHGNAPETPAMVLSEAEKRVAHYSFPDRSPKEAEKFYWENKVKMGRA